MSRLMSRNEKLRWYYRFNKEVTRSLRDNNRKLVSGEDQEVDETNQEE